MRSGIHGCYRTQARSALARRAVDGGDPDLKFETGYKLINQITDQIRSNQIQTKNY